MSATNLAASARPISSRYTEAEVSARFAAGPDRYIDVGTSRIATWRFGHGPDVVCVHGWPLHGATFRRLIPYLAEDFTLHVIDLPGTGHTKTGPDAGIDMRAHARVVRAVVDALGLTRYALLGHDSGASIARFAAEGDARVAAIVMGNTEIPHHRPWQLRVFKALAWLPGGMALFFAAMRFGLVRRSSFGFGGCFTDPSYCDGPFHALFVQPMSRSRRVAEGQMKFLDGFDFDVVDTLAAAHARISARVLCVWGEEDDFFPVARARAMLSQFPAGAELVEIPRGKLFVHEDHPETFSHHTLAFLRAHLPA
jgi:haloalkane dehalogenase